MASLITHPVTCALVTLATVAIGIALICSAPPLSLFNLVGLYLVAMLPGMLYGHLRFGWQGWIWGGVLGGVLGLFVLALGFALLVALGVIQEKPVEPLPPTS